MSKGFEARIETKEIETTNEWDIMTRRYYKTGCLMPFLRTSAGEKRKASSKLTGSGNLESIDFQNRKQSPGGMNDPFGSEMAPLLIR